LPPDGKIGFAFAVRGMALKRQLGYWIGIGALLAGQQASAQVSLSTVVDLAVRNSTQVHIAMANVQHALAGVTETKDAYLPSFVLGSSLGYSYGFPVGQPSVYNVGSQSLIYSFSQPDYIRAARASLRAAELNMKDSEEQVALDAALAYVQLDNDLHELAALDEEKGFAEKLVEIEQQRLDAGVDGRMELTKAELTSAQVDEKRLHIEDDANQLRQKLAHLSGLPATNLMTEGKSIPADPNILPDSPGENRVAASASIQAAYEMAKSKAELSFGDAKQNYRPQFAFGAEYNRYAEFNNYAEYYLRFQHNNFDIGVQITIPLFDASRRAKARESAAEAVKATSEADQAKNQVSEQVLSLRHSIDELKAQRKIAALKSDLAGEQLAAIQTQMQNGSGSPNAPQVSPKDEQQAHIQERERYQDALDASFQVTSVELNLMRSLGEIQDWVHSTTPRTQVNP
jgi:outer membrane protein TolC